MKIIGLILLILPIAILFWIGWKDWKAERQRELDSTGEWLVEIEK